MGPLSGAPNPGPGIVCVARAGHGAAGGCSRDRPTMPKVTVSSGGGLVSPCGPGFLLEARTLPASAPHAWPPLEQPLSPGALRSGALRLGHP